MADGLADDALLIRHGGGPWSAPSVRGFAREAELQEMLLEHPELIPQVSAPAVACRELESGVGPADVVVVDAAGSLVLVECKLAQNSQSRREIVGQILDYASRFWKMPVEEFERRWRSPEGASPFEAFGDEAVAVREQVGNALASGAFTLMLAVDGINADLRRIVEYLNHITIPETAVLAFELARAADRDVEILMPRVYGQELVESKATTTSRRPSWSIGDYLEALTSARPDLVAPMQALLDDVTDAGWQVYGGSASSPSLIIGTPRGAPIGCWPVSLFTAGSEPTVEIRVYEVASKTPDVAEFVEALAPIPRFVIDRRAWAASGYKKRPSLQAGLFTEETARQQLVEALKVAGSLLSSAAEHAGAAHGAPSGTSQAFP